MNSGTPLNNFNQVLAGISRIGIAGTTVARRCPWECPYLLKLVKIVDLTVLQHLSPGPGEGPSGVRVTILLRS